MIKSSIFVFVFLSFNAFGAPCEGAPGSYHLNPNGSSGGFVANTAYASNQATIEIESSICDKAKIDGRVQVHGKSEIRGDSIVSGSAMIIDSQIYSSPKIAGSSSIIRSIVCQASQINSLKVIDSTYYCNTEDPEPKSPGERGSKTLLGIDSDGDGVRDDIEIWLNRAYSNTPDKDFALELTASKIYVKSISDSLKMKNNQQFQITQWKERLNILKCNEISKYEDFMPEYLNTKDRMMAWIEVTGATHGEAYEPNKINCLDFNTKLGLVDKRKDKK